MQYEFDVESYMNNVNNLLQEIFNIYSNKFSSLHLCIGASSSLKTSNPYLKEYENLSVVDNLLLISNKLSSNLFTLIF